MQIRFTTTVATVSLLVVCGVVMPTAQRRATSATALRHAEFSQSSAAQQEEATFRSSVTLVQIDAIVTDGSGTPVSGLTAEDFEVTEARQPRDILSVAEINIPAPVPDPSSSVAEPDMRTNRTPPGRKYVIALGPVRASRVLRARHAMRDFVDRHLGPFDMASVVLVNRGLSSSGQDFTNNQRLLRAAIDRFSGDAPDSFPATDGTTTQEQDDRFFSEASSPDAFQLAASLRSLIEAVAKVPGRKVLIYVGEGMGTLNAHAARDYNGGSLTPAEREFHNAIAAATRGNVTVYPIDPRGLTSDTMAPLAERNVATPTDLDTRADLAAIADITGGFALGSSNNFDDAFTRIVEENSRFYTIGFSSEHTKRDGKFVPVTVRVKRPGLTVHARNGYVAPLGKARTATEATDRLPAVAEALDAPLPVTDVPMRAVAAAYRGRGAEASVALVVELDVSSLDLVEKNGRYTAELQLSYLATDASGKVRPGRRVKVTAAVPKAALNQPALLTRAITELSLPHGRYQLRVAVGDASRAGSVLYDLEVPDFRRGALTLSGVSLTTASASAVATVKVEDPLAKALPGPPVAARDFARQDSLGLYAEVYTSTHRGTPTVSADLRTSDNVVVRTFSQIRLGPALRDGADAHGISAVTPLAGLAPGAYVLHLEARVGEASVRRAIPIRVF